MIHNAEIYLWGTRIGAVSSNDSDTASFQYDKNFLASNIQLSPLFMPLGPQIYSFPTLNNESFKGLPGLLADSLPDYFGDAVMDAYLESEHRSKDSLTPIERLCYTGKRGMGALEFVPATGLNDSGNELIDVERMSNLAAEVLANREHLNINKEDVSFANLLKFGTSAGGARAKAIIAIDKKTGAICSGQISNKKDFSYWIMKFDEIENNGDHGTKDPKGYTRIEYAYYLMATSAGVNMAECKLYCENNKAHFITKRFDRDPKTGEKIHMQTLAAIAHLDYKTPRICSYETMAKIAYRIGLGQNEINQLYRRMVFNCLAINCDDHVKNFSFLMDRKGIWRLAPAYDITYAYSPSNHWIGQHQMTVNGKSKDINSSDLIAVAKAMNISERDAKEIITSVKESLSKWSEFAASAQVAPPLKESIEKQINRNLDL